MNSGFSFFKSGKTVGKDIRIGDVSEFYYTFSNINYNAFYQRYRFFTEDGKYFFFHETRERKNDYGPTTEKDITKTGTVELSADQWSAFFDLLSGGTVTKRSESAASGGSGPWLYLYWSGDRSKIQEYRFDSLEKRSAFESFCEELAGEDAEPAGESGKAILEFDSFDGGGPEFRVLVDPEIVSCESSVWYFKDDHEKMTGAGYRVTYTFTGLTPGETEMTIEERSPIADNLDHTYLVKVDADLNTTIEHLRTEEASRD